MDTATILLGLASRVQAELDGLYQVPGTPEPDSALDQEGLRNGFDIVNEYLDNNENGLAFEHVLYMIVEPGLVLAAAELEELAAVGRHLGFAESLWARVRSA